MVYAAPPLRARPLLVDVDACCMAARGGLRGGVPIPELTSGTPPGPESPRSVLEAREGPGTGVDAIAAGADVAYGGGIGVDGITTTVGNVSGCAI